MAASIEEPCRLDGDKFACVVHLRGDHAAVFLRTHRSRVFGAVSRFGAGTAERVSGVLAGIADPEGLAEVGEWLVCCETGDEFLARVDPAADEADRHGDRGTSRGNSHSCGA